MGTSSQSTLFCCGAGVFHRLPATSRQLPRAQENPVTRLSIECRNLRYLKSNAAEFGMRLAWRCVAEVSIASNLKVPNCLGENLMSKKAAEHHRKASEHLKHAAHHHEEAAKHHDAGHHEKAAHHAHTARGHVIHGRGHAEEAVKAHTEEHGKK